ncbi:Transposase, Mutator family [Achromobacter sp. MFA1 R4]|nr:Transposase, Mutator family [Achromobacter sp. MFA1 R4]
MFCRAAPRVRHQHQDVDDQEIGPFTPTLISKHERRFTELDDRIIPMYARGMSVREIRAFVAEAIACGNRPLETMCPVVIFDMLQVKNHDDGGVGNKAVCLELSARHAKTRCLPPKAVWEYPILSTAIV